MTTHHLTTKSWNKEIRSVISLGQDDDTVEVDSQEIKTLVAMSLERLCPTKKFVVIVKK